MKKTRIALLAAALAIVSSPGWASTELQGNITGLSAHQVTVDGTQYSVAPGVKLARRVIGDFVAINVDRKAEKGRWSPSWKRSASVPIPKFA